MQSAANIVLKDPNDIDGGDVAEEEANQSSSETLRFVVLLRVMFWEIEGRV